MPESVLASVDSAEGQRFLAFRIDDRLYALRAEDVSEIMRVPALSRVPQAPASLLGLANLRGRVVPVASVRALLNVGAEAESASGLALVLAGAAPVAIKVDSAPVLVSAENMQSRDHGGVARAGEILLGAFSDEKGEVTRVLDIHALLAAAFSARAPEREARARFLSRSSDMHNEDENRQKVISFVVAGQEFALELDTVREIIMAPEIIAPVPNSEEVVVGVTAYRSAILPLLSLRRLLGLDEAAGAGRSKVVVSTIGGTLVGLVADQAKAIVTVGDNQSDPPPAVLAARTGSESQIKAIYRGEDGRRLITILSPQQLFRDDVMERLMSAAGARSAANEDGPAVEHERDAFLVFRLGDDEFALPIASVIEVARVPAQITKVPRTPAFLEGVISFRGEVLPVVDQRRRFDMPVREGDESRRLVVVRSDRHRAGLIVDGVSEVLSNARDAIDPAPDLAGQQTRLVHGVINLETEGRMLMVLDPAELLSRAERSLLDAFAPDLSDDQ